MNYVYSKHFILYSVIASSLLICIFGVDYRDAAPISFGISLSIIIVQIWMILEKQWRDNQLVFNDHRYM